MRSAMKRSIEPSTLNVTSATGAAAVAPAAMQPCAMRLRPPRAAPLASSAARPSGAARAP